MKKNAIYLGIFIISAVLASFTTKFILDKQHADRDMLFGMLYQQRAAEYKALCFQAYNLARIQVDLAVKSGHKNLAIITDLDETAIDNSEGEAYSFQQDTILDIRRWWMFGKAKAIPGAVEFFQYAKSKGVDIYYISNRLGNTAVVRKTRENMQALGFPFTSANDNSHFLFKIPQKQTKRLMY